MTETTMLDLGPAAGAMAALVRGVTDEQLVARTPCEDYSVGDLLDHIMGLSVAFTCAATKSAEALRVTVGDASASAPAEGSASHLDPDWRRRLPAQLDGLVDAWRDPAAWVGTTEAGGITLPADVAGVVALDELVIHGWDLARATGQPFACDPHSVEAVFGLLSASADDGGTEGIFGPVVEIPHDRPLLERAVALSGRDPAWRP